MLILLVGKFLLSSNLGVFPFRLAVVKNCHTQREDWEDGWKLLTLWLFLSAGQEQE